MIILIIVSLALPPLRTVLSILVYVVIILLIHKILPAGNLRVVDVIYGSVFSIAGWFVLSLAFNYFASLFTNYALVYGGLASIVILMIWTYFVCIVLMLGAEINSTIIDFKKREFPFHLNQFMQMNVNLATVDFLYFQHKTADALQLLAETKVLANTMGYTFYVEKSETLEFKILNYKNDVT